jgi:hypothetical protein
LNKSKTHSIHLLICTTINRKYARQFGIGNKVTDDAANESKQRHADEGVHNQARAPSRHHRRQSTNMAALVKVKHGHARSWKSKLVQRKTHRESTRDEARDTLSEMQQGEGKDSDDIRKQGDLLLYTDEALYQRQLNRDHPLVVKMIREWWGTFILTHFDTDGDEKISKGEYISLHNSLNRVLCDEDESMLPSDASMCQMALEDWEADSHGAGHIDRDAFVGALFELADLWTETTDVQEYISFLDFLFANMFEAETERMGRASVSVAQMHAYIPTYIHTYIHTYTSVRAGSCASRCIYPQCPCAYRHTAHVHQSQGIPGLRPPGNISHRTTPDLVASELELELDRTFKLANWMRA